MKLKRRNEPPLMKLTELNKCVKVFETRPYANAEEIVKSLGIVCETYWEDPIERGFYMVQSRGTKQYILHAFVYSYKTPWLWIICYKSYEAEARAIADEMIFEYEI